MTTRIIHLPALVLALALATAASAQPPRGERPRPGSQRFEETAPNVGEAVPDVALYDESGKEQKLREIVRGHYTVLVLGCLT